MRILKGKASTFLIGLIMMTILLCCSNQVKATVNGDFTYTVTNGQAQVTGYTGTGGAVTIPSTLGGAPVTSIGDVAFIRNANITTMIIPQGVTMIASYAFYGCTSLTAISIPQSVTDIIGGPICDGCKDLTTITVDANNLNYSSINGVLYDKAGTTLIECPEGLSTISIPQGVTSIGIDPFSCGTGFTTITVDADNLNYSSIDGVLYNKAGTILIECPGDFTSFSIPQGVTSIGDEAFVDCAGLTTITFNSATTTIYADQFTIPATTTIIGYDPSTAKDYTTKYGNKFEVLGAKNTLQSIAITTPATKLS